MKLMNMKIILFVYIFRCCPEQVVGYVRYSSVYVQSFIQSFARGDTPFEILSLLCCFVAYILVHHVFLGQQKHLGLSERVGSILWYT